ncbi:tRNA-dihydrouridine synthase, putative, C-terminal [Phytophthora cactorum]|nr:tRNA-dihydrouridine synthase, putative, C-terminal [Phytophthora cactorum]
MANVTDAAFRHLVSEIAKPSVMWTEFVSCEALTHDPDSRRRMMTTLKYASGAARGGATLRVQARAVLRVSHDSARSGIRWYRHQHGMPETNVNNQGSGAALILQPDLAVDIVAACKRGAGDLPVSIKTRIGFHHIDYKDWVLRLLGTDPEVLTIHGRTRDEMSKVPAHWDVIGEVVTLAKSAGSPALILGNGDVGSLVEAQQKVDDYGVDGVMLGRALFGNPWLFQGYPDTSHVSVKEKLKKFYGSYLKGVPNARQLRDRMSRTQTPQDVYTIIDEALEYLAIQEQQEQATAR